MQSLPLKSPACLWEIHVLHHTAWRQVPFYEKGPWSPVPLSKTSLRSSPKYHHSVFVCFNPDCPQHHILDKACFIPPLTFHKESGFNNWGSLKRCNGGSQIKPPPQMSLQYESLAMFISCFCYTKCTPGRAHLHGAAVNQGRRLQLGGAIWWDKTWQKEAIKKVFGLGKVNCSNTPSDNKPILLSL